jgi:hypothetical protein
VLEPAAGATVIAGRAVTVRVAARDLSGDQLTGVGFVARRFGSGGNATVDSLVERFNETDHATRDFPFTVPAILPTSTQLDIFGIAFGPRTQARVSVPRSVIVAQCRVGQPGC